MESASPSVDVLFFLHLVICLLEPYKIGQVQPPKEPLPPFLFFHTLPAQTDVHRFCSVKRPQLSCGCMCEWGARLHYIQHVGGIMASFKKGNYKATFFSYRHEWGCCSVYFCVWSPKWLYSVSSCSIITWNLWVWPPPNYRMRNFDHLSL